MLILARTQPGTKIPCDRFICRVGCARDRWRHVLRMAPSCISFKRNGGPGRSRTADLPDLSGRSHQRLDIQAALPALDLAFSGGSFSSSRKCLRVVEVPRSAILDGKGAVVVVFADAFGEVLRMADIEAAGGLATEHVGAETHEVKWWAWAESNGRPHPYQGCALTN
jgi:hypothetical protein